jgi:hypothetical protein
MSVLDQVFSNGCERRDNNREPALNIRREFYREHVQRSSPTPPLFLQDAERQALSGCVEEPQVCPGAFDC